jgi:hypothetical protein
MGHSLSQIRSWDVDHLIDAADHWTATADRWDSSFAEVHQQVHAVAWEGAGADAARDRVTADKAHAAGKGDQLREAASVARRGASDISAAHGRVMYVVEDAQNAKFNVSEDLSVTDKLNVRNGAQRAARQAQAQAFAADIRSRAGELSALDTEVATNITSAAAGIHTMLFAKGAEHVQAVDERICNDPDYTSGIERRFLGSVLGGAAIGGLNGLAGGGVGALPGAITGGSIAGILDLIHETEGDGPKCE